MRNIIFIILISLLLGCSGTTKVKNSSQNIFLLGTYEEGNNLTEPKPVQGEYIKTKMGGVQIIQRHAGYKLFIDVVKAPEKRLYSQTIVENPEDSSSPFIYDHHIDPTTPRTTLTHGPVKGLEVHKDYTIEYVLYEDENHDVEVDRITQKIRSYVDTTGTELKIHHGIRPK